MKNSRVLFKVVFHSVKINIERQVVFFQEKKMREIFKKNDDDFFRKQNIPDFAHDQVAFEVFSHFGWIFLMLKFCSTFKQHLAQIFLSRFFFFAQLSLTQIHSIFQSFFRGRGKFFFISGGLVALDGALKKLIKKRKRKILVNFCCAFLLAKKKLL
jgi:hypothetical protein